MIKNVYQHKHWEIFNPMEQARLLSVLRGLAVAEPGRQLRALDYGAGTGNVTHKLLALGYHVTACDISPDSLELLKLEAKSEASLDTVTVDGSSLPFTDGQFDLVTLYSVLHHVPDYLRLIRGLIGVLKPGGTLFIDHEFNGDHWSPSLYLDAYYELTRRSFVDYLKEVWSTGELITFDYFKGVFIKTFLDRRYEREGDLHVWPDDHIGWDKIVDLLQDCGCSVGKNVDYLLYRPKGGEKLYELFADRCADMKYIVAIKP